MKLEFRITEVASHWCNIDVYSGGTICFTFGCIWDGCVNIYRYLNGATDINSKENNYMHLCDLDEMIKILQEIKRLRLELLPQFEFEWEQYGDN